MALAGFVRQQVRQADVVLAFTARKAACDVASETHCKRATGPQALLATGKAEDAAVRAPQSTRILCDTGSTAPHLYTGSPVVGRGPPPLPLFGNQLRVKRIAYGTREVTPRASTARIRTLYLQCQHAGDAQLQGRIASGLPMLVLWHHVCSCDVGRWLWVAVEYILRPRSTCS